MTTPGQLTQFTHSEIKAASICRRMAGRDVPARLKRMMTKSADDHLEMAEDVGQFIGKGYHDAQHN